MASATAHALRVLPNEKFDIHELAKLGYEHNQVLALRRSALHIQFCEVTDRGDLGEETSYVLSCGLLWRDYGDPVPDLEEYVSLVLAARQQGETNGEISLTTERVIHWYI